MLVMNLQGIIPKEKGKPIFKGYIYMIAHM